jgi:nicotinamidase-related amidase
VRATGKRTLIIAGVWTTVCVAFPALSAVAEGFRVFALIDASGDVSAVSAQVTTARLVQALAGVEMSPTLWPASRYRSSSAASEVTAFGRTST